METKQMTNLLGSSGRLRGGPIESSESARQRTGVPTGIASRDWKLPADCAIFVSPL